MYAIYAGNTCIYSDVFALDSMKIINPKLTLSDCAAGSLTMKLPPNNVGYDAIERLITDIIVKKDDTEIWAGRVLSESKDFLNNRVLYCEGELAFFNDSSQPPKQYSALSIRGYLEALIAIHNSKVGANRQFQLGAITINDDKYPDRYTNYEKTMTLLNALVEEYGGHMKVRKLNGVRYLDYLEECPNACTQTIQMGVNLIDFTKSWDMTEFATVIVPLGARLSDGPIEAIDAYLTVADINGGSIYVQSDEAIAAYGWIEKTVRFDDVTDPNVLMEKAQAYLSDLQFDNMQLELSALDMHYLDVDTEAVKLLDEIRVISFPHGLDRLFPVTQLEIPLDSPEKTTFKLGDTVQTSLTVVNNKTNQAILDRIEDLPKAHNILKEAKENATAIMNMATTGFITITKDQYGSETLYISNTRDYTVADKLWKWNMNGLGYSKDGGETYGLAITMDGEIVADFITAGTMSANRVRTGVLEATNKNVVFDLDEGKLTMKNGSIYLGAYNNTSNHYKFEVDEDGNLYAGSGIFAGKLVGADITGATGTFSGHLSGVDGTFSGILSAAKISGDLISDPDTNNGMLRGVALSIGEALDANGTVIKRNFHVDHQGNVTMKGNITIDGNITWGVGNSPCLILYARSALSKPMSKYSDYGDSSTSNWHKLCDSTNDYYVSYTYDGGNTWTNAIQLRGINGHDGTDGSDATVTRYAIYRAMLSNVSDGIYSHNGNILLRASAIKSGTIDADEVTLGSNWGGFCCANGFDGVGNTIGAMMYGSDSDYYVIATNRGVRMQASGMSMYVTENGCYTNEGTIQTSDRRVKNNITYNLDAYRQFFHNLKPTPYRRNDGKSGRYHIGFIAQDVEQAILDSGLTTNDFAGFVRAYGPNDAHEKYEDQCSLRYDEFIALNTYMIQLALTKIDELNRQIQSLKGE